MATNRLKATIIADGKASAPVEVVVDLERPLAPAGPDPVFIKGKIADFSPEGKGVLEMAKEFRIVFEGINMSYGAVIDKETWSFRAVDTSERGV
jgi:hypothetical protein